MSEFVYDINGKQVKLAAIATPKRISAYCQVFGKNKLSELIMPNSQSIDESARGMNTLLLDAIGDSSMTQKILNACTEEIFTVDEAAEVDSEITGRIALDFFLLLIVKYFRQPK